MMAGARVGLNNPIGGKLAQKKGRVFMSDGLPFHLEGF